MSDFEKQLASVSGLYKIVITLYGFVAIFILTDIGFQIIFTFAELVKS